MTASTDARERRGAPETPPRVAGRADARRNYQALVRTAAEAFADEGPRASMHGIARRAGVGVGTLYRHFPTREDLLEAVFVNRMELLRTRAEELAGHPSPLTALSEWLRCHMESGRAGRSLAAGVLSAQLDREGGPGGSCAAMAEAGQVLLDRGVASGAVRPEARLYDLIKMVQGIVLVAEGTPEADALADRLLDLLIRGLRPG